MRAEQLRLDDTHAIRVVPGTGGPRAEAVTARPEGWVRSVPGDGAGLAVLGRLRGGPAVDGFRVTGGAELPLANADERAMGVDQTHASWVVGERVVVKWMTEPLVGPHPAADRLRRLARAGFAESPELVGLVEWRDPGTGGWVPVVLAQAYLPGAVDGWTWALEDARRSLGVVPGVAQGVGEALGGLVGRMHRALADRPAGRLTEELAHRRAIEARDALHDTLRLLERHHPGSHALLAEHSDAVEGVLARLHGAAGTPVLWGHGDLHVGQVLRDAAGRQAVVDFDGNPTLPAVLRAAPSPAADDVASMLVSLENVEHVVRHHAPDVPDAAALAWTRREQDLFLGRYREALGDRVELYDEELVPAYEWEQVCREVLYAVRHDLPEWLYVPAAALRRRLAPSP